MAFNKQKIQELYPGAIMYEAQLINKGTDNLLKNACESGNYFGQLKMDGYWYQYEKHQEGQEYLFSRSASRTTGLQSEKGANVPHIMNALSCLPKETILIGEIYYPGGSSKTTTTIMGCLPQKALERQNGSYGLIHYYIHDILMYDGVDFVLAETGSWDRYRILQKIWEKHNLSQYNFLELAEAWEDNLFARIGDALASGEEGMVIKDKNGKYEPGKRPTTNLKAKKVDFADVVIVGFEGPTVNYEGKELESWPYWVGTDDHEERLEVKCHYGELCCVPVTKPYYMRWNNARLKVGLWRDGRLVEIGTIHSGISDEMKQDMSENPNRYLGKVCSIQMMEVDKIGGTIRHGFFKLMRPDKNDVDCKYEDVFGQK
jgi:ATP-dependent DNA ligase